MAQLKLQHDNFRGWLTITPNAMEPDKFRVTGKMYNPLDVEADSLHNALEKLVTGQVKLTKADKPVVKSAAKSQQMKDLWSKIKGVAKPASASGANASKSETQHKKGQS